jgi:hypothetical protein
LFWDWSQARGGPRHGGWSQARGLVPARKLSADRGLSQNLWPRPQFSVHPSNKACPLIVAVPKFMARPHFPVHPSIKACPLIVGCPKIYGPGLTSRSIPRSRPVPDRGLSQNLWHGGWSQARRGGWSSGSRHRGWFQARGRRQEECRAAGASSSTS